MDKTILITGVASGIGEATLTLFSENNWKVIGVDVNGEGLKKVEEKCVFTFQCDVSKRKDVEALAKRLKKENIALDALFNSAGILRMGLFKDIKLSEQVKEIDINLKGIVNTTYLLLPFLKKGSAIVNMSSLSGIYGTPELAVYSATKSAVKTLTEALNIEFEKQGIFVCDILVDYVKTPMILNAHYKAASVKRLGITVSPQQVAKTVFKAISKKNKVHHYVGIKAKTLNFLAKLFPFLSRFLTKLLAFK